MNPAYEKLLKCYDSYKAKIDFTPKVALILGSGLGDYADDIRVVDTLDYHDIEGFPVSTVPGHKADLSSDMWMMSRSCACRGVCIIMRDMR